MSQRILCTIIALITHATVVIAQAQISELRHAILHNQYGCVAYIHRETYHRLCEVDEIPIDALFNFALSSGPQGKAITVDPDGYFKITLLSGFPVPKNPSNPRYEDVPDSKQVYVWKAGASQEEDNSGMWVMADTFCLARKGELLNVQINRKGETEPVFFKVNSNGFQIIGVCPQPAYTGPLLPNPYRMAIDGKARVPLKYSDSAAGSGALASIFDNTIENSSLDLLPAKEYWQSVDKASTIAEFELEGILENSDRWE